MFISYSFRNEYIVDCHCSIRLQVINTFLPNPFCLIVSTPSIIFLCVRPFSILMIIDHSQLIPSPHSVLCFTKPPSCSFIRSVVHSMFPAAMPHSAASLCPDVLSDRSPIFCTFHRYTCTLCSCKGRCTLRWHSTIHSFLNR